MGAAPFPWQTFPIFEDIAYDRFEVCKWPTGAYYAVRKPAPTEGRLSALCPQEFVTMIAVNTRMLPSKQLRQIYKKVSGTGLRSFA